MRQTVQRSALVVLAVAALAVTPRAQQPGGDAAAREAQQRATAEDH